MDPKMDSGFLLPNETLEDSYNVLAPILPEEVIGIMDQLLCYEMAWHTGYPLSQTLFTSVYIDKLLWPEPKTVEEAQFYRGDLPAGRRPGVLLEVLRAYCLALVKCCDFVIAKITGRDYFEEEDFCTHTYNRVLFVQVPLDVFLRELDAAVERMEDTDLEMSSSLRKAIISRLDFRRDFLRALDLDCPLEHLSNYWPPILSNLTSIFTTQQLGKTVPGSFSTKIQRRLASTVPPRPIVELEFKDAFEKLKQLCIDCEEATRFTSLEPDPLEYQSFLLVFASRAPTPLPYSRSYLATLLFHPQILNATSSLPLTDVRTLVLPCSTILSPANWSFSPPRNPLLPKPPRLQLALLVDEFIERTGQPYLDFWTALGQNTCRLRRMLTHVIGGWDQLQTDASIVDADLMRVVTEMGMRDEVMDSPLTVWVYQKKLWMIEKCVLLGFEQDIYLPDEYGGMYHFLSLISGRRKVVLEAISAHFVTRARQLQHADQLPEAADVEDGAQHIASLISEADGVSSLGAALASFYTVLLYLKVLPRPARPFSSQELRFELRMKPFLALQPPEVPPFKDWLDKVQPYGPYELPSPSFLADVQNADSQLWSNMDANIKRAKEAFSAVMKIGATNAKCGGVKEAWARDVKGVLASCVALGIAVAGVRSRVARSGGGIKMEVEMGVQGLGIGIEIPLMGTAKRYAEGWVVAKVVKG
ncbi:amino-acid N-acetyltransferas-like protein subunit Mak10 [Melanomma pulvis-pyrius CBS 109.77]|uniref:Amino-acid N-acetyltransferas-like protein subunit Mak10 n=1 Tax=Melanomma pulvis-pyrius CBS 109.77 TaxID=1314802 RepID=A0A6A6WYB8_9PLEO|nr:amino-acid N-acetyltransferas-like protein subunit Mak10 [Melanomma pulvis-pyrius CBS 109.77]